MTRLIQCLALFLIYSPLVGIIPLDGGNGFKQWKKSFMENILMAYGSVIGMNLFFLILPFLYQISFFNNLILDRIMSMLFIIAGLSLIKKFMKLLGGFIGAADASDTGKDVAESVKNTGAKAAGMTMKAAAIGVGIGKIGARGYGVVAKKIGKGIGNKISESKKKKWLKKNEGKTEQDYKAHLKEKADEKAAKKAQGHPKLKKVGKVTGAIVAGVGALAFGGVGAVAGLFQKKQTEKRPVYKKNEKGEYVDKDGNPTTDKSKMVQETDDKGNPLEEEVETVPSGLKAFGKGLLDLSGTSLKLAGEISGITSLFKSLSDSKVFDSAKEGIAMFGQSIGAFKKDSVPDALQTAKQKEDAKGDKEKEAHKEHMKAIEEQNKLSNEMLDAIKKLTNKFEGK